MRVQLAFGGDFAAAEGDGRLGAVLIKHTLSFWKESMAERMSDRGLEALYRECGKVEQAVDTETPFFGELLNFTPED